jgi:glutamate dehydrogenase (NAD(P)+)
MSDGTSTEVPARTAQDILGRDKDPHLDEDNPFEAMMARFDHAAELLDLDPGVYRVLRHPEKQLIVSVPIQRDNGDLEGGAKPPGAAA